MPVHAKTSSRAPRHPSSVACCFKVFCPTETRKTESHIAFYNHHALSKVALRTPHYTRRTPCSTRTRRSSGRRTSTRPLTNGPPRVRTPSGPSRRERPTRRAPATPWGVLPPNKSTDRPAQCWQPCRQLLRTHCLRAWRNQRRRAWRATAKKGLSLIHI